MLVQAAKRHRLQRHWRGLVLAGGALLLLVLGVSSGRGATGAMGALGGADVVAEVGVVGDTKGDTVGDRLWTRNESICDAVFGNAYTTAITVCDPTLSCKHSPALGAAVCTAHNVAINTEQIHVAKGGVPLETVMGQQEAVEFPKFGAGAFEQQCTMQSVDPSMVSIMESSILGAWKTLLSPPECTHRYKGITLAFTRDTYANYYHHILMWYLVYVLQQTMGIVPSRILLIDGHPAASLDVTWEQLFAPHMFISDVVANSCFDELIIMPFEKTSPIWPREEQHLCPEEEHIAAFRSYLLQSLRLELQPPTQTIVVTLILRKDHMSHPRKNGWVSRRITNEEEVVAIQPRLRSPYRLDFRIVSYEFMGLREQVATMMDSNVVVGVHGAGLANTLFLRPGSVLMELNVLRAGFFRNMATLTGVQYLESQSGSMQGAHFAVYVNTQRYRHDLVAALNMFRSGIVDQ